MSNHWRLPLLGVLLAWFALLATAHAGEPPPVHEGDLVFQSSRSAQSLAIQLATGSRWSHMGVVVFRNGRPYVLEAKVSVRYTPLAGWLARGKDGHYAVRRLRDTAAIDTPAGRAALRKQAQAMLGRPYDNRFAWADDKLYCSELAWKLYHNAYGITLAPLSHWSDFKLDSPEVRARLRERFGDMPPPDEPLIAPGDIYRSTLLVTVAEH